MSFYNLKNIRNLIISKNYIKEIHGNIINMTNIQILFLGKNNFTDLPIELYKMKNL